MDSRQRGPCSPYKPGNRSLFIGKSAWKLVTKIQIWASKQCTSNVSWHIPLFWDFNSLCHSDGRWPGKVLVKVCRCGLKTVNLPLRHGIWHLIYRYMWFNTIDSRYIMVIYNTIIHTEQSLQWDNFGQTLHSWMTPHISPSRASYGVSFMGSLKKYHCDISRVHCIESHNGLLPSILWSPCQVNITFECFWYNTWFGSDTCNIKWRQDCI